MNEWNAQLLRVTVFPVPIEISEDVLLNEWWIPTVGDSPDRVTNQPKQQQIVLESDYDLGRLALQVSLERIDWLYISSEPDTLSDIPILGAFSTAVESFAALINKWLSIESSPDAKRFAFGAILNSGVSSRDEGYRRLSSYLPINALDPEGTTDFMLQINQPRTVKMNDGSLPINRLTKWSVAMRQGIVFSSQSRMALSSSSSLALQLELDISTPPLNQEQFSDSEQQWLLNLMIEFGKEISERGAIP